MYYCLVKICYYNSDFIAKLHKIHFKLAETTFEKKISQIMENRIFSINSLINGPSLITNEEMGDFDELIYSNRENIRANKNKRKHRQGPLDDI